jgi:hypothetical protein
MENKKRKRRFKYRWFYVSNGLTSRSEVKKVKKIVSEAAGYDYNGMVLHTDIDSMSGESPAFLKRLESVKRICSEKNIEIIPTLFDAGYGSNIIEDNPNLAAGIPVKDALYRVKNGRAELVPEYKVKIKNSGFEEHSGDRVKGYFFQDKPGRVSFVDCGVKKEGRSSLRFENLDTSPHKRGRLAQKIRVHPYRCYRLSFWLKTSGLSPYGCFRVLVYTEDERWLVAWGPDVPPDTNWRKIVLGFNSLNYNSVILRLGDWGATGGKYWLDDLQIQEIGLINILRRPGTPMTVHSDKTGARYEEGKDYAPVVDKNLDFRFNHKEPALKTLSGSHIKNGEKLRVSYYQGLLSNSRIEAGQYVEQVSLCMSEREVYEYWRKQAHLIHKHLTPDKYFLGMDEIRAGGSCALCKKSGLTMGQILGKCLTEQWKIIRSIKPEAEVFVWSDMFDPYHNAKEGRFLFLVEGTAKFSWKYIPKEIKIVCWNYGTREKSLKHFSKESFETIAAVYYDDETLMNIKGWLKTLDKSPKTSGVMYTTWQNNHSFLGALKEPFEKK